MDDSQIQLSDVRAVIRLIGECRELGVDSNLWGRHMLTALLRLTGGQVAMGGMAAFAPEETGEQPSPGLEIGWSGRREREYFLRYRRHGMHLKDPVMRAIGARLVSCGTSSGRLTCSRDQLVDDRTYYRSEAFCDYKRTAGLDDTLMSFVKFSGAHWHTITLHRPVGAPRFSERDRKLLDVFHAALAPYLLSELAPPGCDPISKLSPRLRQVLGCLLEGDSEKQAAARLGLTVATTHQYVKALYARLHVSSRGELMARFVRFPVHHLADDMR